ncbi:MAG: DNA translocase FtsK [Actinomycetota bacterium]|nr:DNA translocase FtsK [Actinomycetota bacterium]MDA3009702.1 DNA translocase FtsK [Actinomycetota bacterium]
MAGRSAPKKPTKGSKAAESSSSGRRGKAAAAPEAEADDEHDVIGIALVALGLVIALAIWVGLAGPLGDAVDTFLGWIFGGPRLLLPVALVAVGVTVIRGGRLASPRRLIGGWVTLWCALTGLVHVVDSPATLTDAADLADSAGAVGALIGEPLERLLDSVGAFALLLLLAIAGLILVTGSSLRTAVPQTVKLLRSAARPVAAVLKRTMADLSTLRSERAAEVEDWDDDEAPELDGDPYGEASAPAPYDLSADDDFAEPEGAPKPKRKPRRPAARAAEPAVERPVVQPGEWRLPAGDLLVRTGAQSIDKAAVEERGLTLQDSLAQHGVETQLVGSTVGPTVTRYELELGPGVKVAKVTSLQKDIAYAMAATDVRILAPIPGRSAIGVEVPNSRRQLVALGDLLNSPEATAAEHPLEVAIGKDIAGRPVFLNLATTPHLLIAGATGAGKSSGINCIITSLLMRTTPDHVRLILIDPKQVEMGQYQRLPHLLTQPVTNPKKAANALGWAVKEMERRYDVLSEVGYRDVTGFNNALATGKFQVPAGRNAEEFEHLPYIVVVVDELNDLMMVAARDVEESITRIAQKARAVGIHLIVATQRPSVNVITGVIKANVPARVAFAVSSLTDSRVILDQPGAEKLVGKGDMLLLPGNSSVANRIQGSFVSEDEVRAVVEHWRAQAPEPVYSGDVQGPADSASSTPSSLDLDVTSDANAFSAGEDDEDTVVMRQAMELVVRSQLGSTSMLQRKLKVGFARAGRIMDLLEQRGVVGPSEGSKAREVLMTVEEFEALHGS